MNTKLSLLLLITTFICFTKCLQPKTEKVSKAKAHEVIAEAKRVQESAINLDGKLGGLILPILDKSIALSRMREVMHKIRSLPPYKCLKENVLQVDDILEPKENEQNTEEETGTVEKLLLEEIVTATNYTTDYLSQHTNDSKLEALSTQFKQITKIIDDNESNDLQKLQNLLDYANNRSNTRPKSSTTKTKSSRRRIGKTEKTPKKRKSIYLKQGKVESVFKQTHEIFQMLESAIAESRYLMDGAKRATNRIVVNAKSSLAFIKLQEKDTEVSSVAGI